MSVDVSGATRSRRPSRVSDFGRIGIRCLESRRGSRSLRAPPLREQRQPCRWHAPLLLFMGPPAPLGASPFAWLQQSRRRRAGELLTPLGRMRRSRSLEAIGAARDREIAGWVARMGAADAVHVMALFGMGRTAAYRRLRVPCDAGLVERVRLVIGAPSLFL